MSEEDDIVDDYESDLQSDNGKTKTIVVLPESEWTTPDIINRYEFARAVCVRAAAILRGAPTFINVSGLVAPGKNIAITIAEQEIFQKKCPLRIRRFVRNSPSYAECELRPINDLILTKDCVENFADLIQRTIKEDPKLADLLAK